MKQIVIAAAIMLIVRPVSILYADSIKDTYISGDVLTVGAMGTIKSAVDDNFSSTTSNAGNINNNDSSINSNSRTILGNADLLLGAQSNIAQTDFSSTKSGSICTGFANVVINGTITEIASVDITVAGPGTVLIMGNSQLQAQSTGVGWNVNMYPADINTTSQNATSANAWVVPANLRNGQFQKTGHVQEIFTVNAAGLHSFFLRATNTRTRGDVVQSFRSTLCAIFTPQ